MSYIGIGPDSEILKRRQAFFNNGMATINRVDEDTLVIQRSYQMPNIYVRCPD